MQAASLTLTILLAGALVVLWWRSVDWSTIDDHAERMSQLEQQARNSKASIEALTFCVEELQDRQFEHSVDHASPRNPAAKRDPAKADTLPLAAPVQPAVKKAAPKKPPTKTTRPVSAR